MVTVCLQSSFFYTIVFFSMLLHLIVFIGVLLSIVFISVCFSLFTSSVFVFSCCQFCFLCFVVSISVFANSTGRMRIKELIETL